MNTFDDSAVRAWYSNPQRFRPMDDPALKAIDHRLLDRVGTLSNKHVLDVGCFYPETEILYASRALTWTAVDFCPEVVDACIALRAWPASVSFMCRDMRQLGFVRESFDVVLDFSSGDHMTYDEWLKATAEIHRVLRPGGSFICTYANSDYFGGRDGQAGDYGYERYTTPLAMRASLSGFRVEHEFTGHARSGLTAVRL